MCIPLICYSTKIVTDTVPLGYAPCTFAHLPTLWYHFHLNHLPLQCKSLDMIPIQKNLFYWHHIRIRNFYILFRTSKRRARPRFLNPRLSRSAAAIAHIGRDPIASAGWSGTTRWKAHSRRPTAFCQWSGNRVYSNNILSMLLTTSTEK